MNQHNRRRITRRESSKEQRRGKGDPLNVETAEKTGHSFRIRVDRGHKCGLQVQAELVEEVVGPLGEGLSVVHLLKKPQEEGKKLSPLIKSSRQGRGRKKDSSAR